MRKLTVLIILILMLTMFTGCGESVESGIQSKWLAYEIYQYDVTKASESVGTLTLESIRITNTDVTIGGKTYNSMIGTKINYSLVLTNGIDSIMSEVFFTARFVPLYSYKEIVDATGTTIIDAKYVDNQYIYKKTKGSDVVDSTISMKGALGDKSVYYDNEMINYVLRSVDMTGKNFSFSFKTPSPQEDKPQSRTAALIEKNDLSIMGDVINCYHLRMNINQRITGTPYDLYYAVNPIVRQDAENVDKDVRIALVKFVEGEYTYTLTSLDIKPLVIE